MLQGFILSVAGMGTVFLFLVLLVLCMGLNARMVRLLEAKGFVRPAAMPGTAATSKKDDMARVAAAIAVARKTLGKP